MSLGTVARKQFGGDSMYATKGHLGVKLQTWTSDRFDEFNIQTNFRGFSGPKAFLS